MTASSRPNAHACDSIHAQWLSYCKDNVGIAWEGSLQWKFDKVEMATIGWIVVVVAGVWATLTTNGLVSLRHRCRQAFCDIDVQLKQRHDLVPNLVEIVKGYAAHEGRRWRASSKPATPPSPPKVPQLRRPPRCSCTGHCARSSPGRSLSGPEGQS